MQHAIWSISHEAYRTCDIGFIIWAISRTLTAYPFFIRKIPTDFSKNKAPGTVPGGPPVGIMSRHKLEVIQSLIIETGPS